MDLTRISFKKLRWPLLAGLLALVGLVVLHTAIIRPFYLFITDQEGTFHVTFSVADLDLDGDLDVLVHNKRSIGDFEAYAGGTLWINQSGLQGGQAGQFLYRRNDLEGGWASTLADLEGDGDPDVLVYDGYYLTLGLNQGGRQGGQAGVFRQGNRSTPPDELAKRYPVSQYGSVVAGDTNGDGRVDALVLGCCRQAYNPIDGVCPPNFSWVWFNTTDAEGRLSGQRQTANLAALEGLPVTEAALADLDGDKDLDLFAVTLKAAAASSPEPAGLVLLNDGAGHFDDSGQRLEAGNSTSMVLGDLDGDGDLDVLVGTSRGATVWINQGGAQAGQAGSFIASGAAIVGRQTRSIRLSDLDGDDDLDAIVVGQSQADCWWNDGQGYFTRAGQSFHVSDHENLTIGDFNGDGRPDIFIARYDCSAQVWFNDGLRSFKVASR